MLNTFDLKHFNIERHEIILRVSIISYSTDTIVHFKNLTFAKKPF